MPARTITLVRHGQTEASARLAYSGRLDIALTPAGREQARVAAQRLASAGIDGVYTSPLARAHETAQAIADAAGAPLTVDDRFIEIDYGPLEGCNRDAARAAIGQAFQDWRDDPFGTTVAGAEPLAAALQRARAATADVLDACEHPVVVGHQGILRIVLIALGELAPGDYFSRRLNEAEPVVVQRPSIG